MQQIVYGRKIVKIDYVCNTIPNLNQHVATWYIMYYFHILPSITTISLDGRIRLST